MHYEYNKPLQLLFIDFKQAYDFIEKIMKKFGILSRLVRMVRACIEGSRCKIKFGNSYTEEFETTVRLKQGDTLSLTLFNIALGEVFRKVQEISKLC